MTTTFNINTSIGEFIVDRPGRSRVFEDFGISYCCKAGEISLANACAKAEIDANEVLDHLLRTNDSKQEDFEKMSLAQLADHIEQIHHAWLRDELPRIDGLLRRVAQAHGSFSPWVIEILRIYEAFQIEMCIHMTKEEQVLFPLIRNGEAGLPLPEPMLKGINGPISCMEHEHGSALSALAEMRELSNGFTPPESACNTFRAMLDSLVTLEEDTKRHIQKEDGILFPKALECFAARNGSIEH